MKIKFFTLIGTILLTSGCAFTVHDLPVNYKYSGPAKVVQGDNLPTIIVTDIVDTRMDKPPLVAGRPKRSFR